MYALCVCVFCVWVIVFAFYLFFFLLYFDLPSWWINAIYLNMEDDRFVEGNDGSIDNKWLFINYRPDV